MLYPLGYGGDALTFGASLSGVLDCGSRAAPISDQRFLSAARMLLATCSANLAEPSAV